MEQLLEILRDVKDDIDYENCTTLIDDKLLDSFAIMSIVAEIQDEYDIQITRADLVPANFNSAAAMLEMINRLKG